ncbi:MAG: rod shape-determining protein MreC [Planctomycetes bacterium]|nr:rod shape-determining protein MreC [Planctomycetota bacterium]
MRPTNTIVLMILLTASGITTLVGSGFSSRLRGLASLPLAPLGDGGMYLSASVRERMKELASEQVSQEQARELKNTCEELRDTVISLEAGNEELRRRLEELQALRPGGSEKPASRSFAPLEYDYELIPAHVIMADSLPYSHGRLVNPKRSGAIAPGMPVAARRLITDRLKNIPSGLPVINTMQLVGRIIESGPFTARMQLVTDRDFRSVPARIIRIIDPHNPRQVIINSAIQTLTEDINRPISVIVDGDGADGMTISDVPHDHQVRPGDRLATSGKDLALPAAIPIGTVTDVKGDPKNPSCVIIKVRPLMDLSAIRDVYIVWTPGSNPVAEKSGGDK